MCLFVLTVLIIISATLKARRAKVTETIIKFREAFYGWVRALSLDKNHIPRPTPYLRARDIFHLGSILELIAVFIYSS
jgi:hypothetical protein